MIESEKRSFIAKRIFQVQYALKKGETIYLGLSNQREDIPQIVAASNPSALSKPFARIEFVFPSKEKTSSTSFDSELSPTIIEGVPPYKRLVLLMNNDHLFSDAEQLFLRRLRMQILSSRGYKSVKTTKSMVELFSHFPNRFYIVRMIPQAIFGFLDGYL